MSDFNELQQWLDNLVKKPAVAPRRVINAAVHKKLDREEPANDAAARMLEELEWDSKALVCMQTRSICRCGHESTSTDGIFIRKEHPRRQAIRFVPVKFFPDHPLPREFKLVERHLDICAACFIEEALASELVEMLDHGFAVRDPQLRLFDEIARSAK